MAVAERALEAPSVVRLLDEEMVRIARAEIAGYRRDPSRYIARHVGGEQAVGRMADRRPLGRLPDLKAKVREHWNSTLTRLLLDLRIFCGSNLVAAVVAGWCALSAKEGRPTRLLGVGALLLGSLIYCAYAYVDRLSYFRILFELYVGWWYPILLGAAFGWMYVTHGPAPLPAREDRHRVATNVRH